MDGPMYLILSKRGAPGALLWWGPAGGGYTTNIDEAGRYTRSTALMQQRMRPEVDVAVPENVALRRARRSVSDDDLHEVLMAANAVDDAATEPNGKSLLNTYLALKSAMASAREVDEKTSDRILDIMDAVWLRLSNAERERLILRSLVAGTGAR